MKYTDFSHGFFYGNYFYGVCAMGLSIEATLQQGFPLAEWSYYVVVFALSVWFYTLPYLIDKEGVTPDLRTKWFLRHKSWVRFSQYLLLAIIMLYGLSFLFRYGKHLLQMDPLQWGLALIVPAVGVAYYGISFNEQYNLRKIGILKPFFIGFCWAGLCTLYPVLWHKITHAEAGGLDGIGYRLFIKNMMYIAMLGIMFDIKDYASDSRSQLKTIVVQKGLRNTLYNIILPLSIIGLATFWLYGFTHEFSIVKIFLNTVPFIALLLAIQLLKKRRSLLFYLVVIDGLMLLKAICGSIAMLYF